MVDWFRKTTWTDADREDFHARLARSTSSFHKAQYLRIQAVHLEQSGQPDLLRAALELLDMLVTEYPDPMQLAQAHAQRGQCLLALGEPDPALVAFRDAVEAQRRKPNMRTDAYLSFGELVLTLERSELYGAALAILDELGGGEAFPIERYRSAAIRALVLHRLGQSDLARQFASKALEAADQRDSGLRYHPRLGLVTDVGTPIHGQLLALLGRTH